MNGLSMYGVIVVILGLVIWRRTRAMNHPIHGSGIQILLPIIYLYAGMYALSNLHLQLKIGEICVAGFVGVLLSVPLMWTTNYEIRQDGQIYAQKNKTFFFALIAILLIRIILRQFISGMDPASLGMLFYTVAYCYVVPWRIASFIKFRMVKRSQNLVKVIS